MNNNDKLTPRQEKFVNLVLQGMTLTKAYFLSFPDSNNSKTSAISVKASQMFNSEKIHKRYEELREIMEKELQQRAIWSKEQAINEIKDVMYANKREMERYEEAYNDEVEIINKRIKEKEELKKKPKTGKKRIKELDDEIDKLKLAKISCLARHRSSKATNEAVLNAIEKLNCMCGIDKVNKDSIQLDANINFVDNVPEDDEEYIDSDDLDKME